MGSPGPTRGQVDLADMLEMLLDKGVVINADIAVSIGDTELLGVQVRAALASFETAAEYGLEFPEGTDMDRVEEAAAGRPRRQVEGESNEGEAEGDEAGSEDEEVTAVADAEGSADAADGSGAPESESPHGVAVRPEATTGDGGSGGDAEDASEGDDGAG